MKKTPMQEAIDKVNSFEYVLHKKDVIKILTELLENGNENITYDEVYGYDKTGTFGQYYKKTFKQKYNEFS
jgi:nitrogen regulatory protein PII